MDKTEEILKEMTEDIASVIKAFSERYNVKIFMGGIVIAMNEDLNGGSATFKIGNLPLTLSNSESLKRALDSLQADLMEIQSKKCECANCQKSPIH